MQPHDISVLIDSIDVPGTGVTFDVFVVCGGDDKIDPAMKRATAAKVAAPPNP